MRVPAGQDNMNHLRFVLEALGYLCRSEHTVADGVIDLVEDHQIPTAGENRPLGFRPGFFHHPDVFGVWLLAPTFTKPRPICFMTNLSPNACTASSSP